MIQPLRRHYDKLLLVLAAVTLGLSLEWVRRQRPAHGRLSAEVVAPDLRGGVFAPETRGTVPGAPSWIAPLALAHGGSGTVEVFGAPSLSFDSATRMFATAPQSRRPEPGADWPSSPGVPGIVPEPSLLQLAGYFGPPEDRLVAFTFPGQAEPMLVRTGHRFAGLGIVFQRFESGRMIVAENEAGPVWEVVARAVLYDERSQREVVLDTRATRHADRPAGTPVALNEP